MRLLLSSAKKLRFRAKKSRYQERTGHEGEPWRLGRSGQCGTIPEKSRFNIGSLQTILACFGSGRFLKPIFDLGGLFDEPSSLVSLRYF
jgi:hypothetical protein